MMSLLSNIKIYLIFVSLNFTKYSNAIAVHPTNNSLMSGHQQRLQLQHGKQHLELQSGSVAHQFENQPINLHPRHSQGDIHFGPDFNGVITNNHLDPTLMWNQQQSGLQGVPTSQQSQVIWGSSTNQWPKVPHEFEQQDEHFGGSQSHSDHSHKLNTRTILNDLLVTFIGPVKRKVGGYNAKQYLPEYRRYYWIGERYFIMDHDSSMAGYITCVYGVPGDTNVFYENEDRVGQIVFQCVKFQESCCNLDCCPYDDHTMHHGIRRSKASAISSYLCFIIIVLQMISILM